MSLFGFSFGRDNKKNNNRRERNDVMLRHESSSEYNDYEEDDNRYYDSRDTRDSRDPQFLRPYRTDDARAHRSSRQRHDHDDFEDEALTGFRRSNTSHDDSPRSEYYPRDEEPSFDQRQRMSSGYDQRKTTSNRPHQRDDLQRLGFWHDDEPDAHYNDSEADADRPSPLKFVVAITGLIFICTITWLAYRWISLPTSDTPPLIQAETDPYRVRPENRGGTDFPHQDKLIYGRLAPNAEQPVERLLPAPEQSVIMAPTYTQPDQPQQQPAHPQQPMPPQPQYPQQQYYPQQGQAPTQAPVYVPANQPGYGQNQATQQYHTQQPVPEQMQHYQGQAYVQQQPQPIQQQSAPDLNGLPQNQPQRYQQPMAQNPATLMEQPTAETKQSAPITLDAVVNAPEVKTEAKAAPADTVQYYLQLGTLPNESLAKKEKERLQKRYANELTGMDLSVKSFIASDGRKKYRIVAGPTIVSRQAALNKCTKLGNACRPVRN